MVACGLALASGVLLAQAGTTPARVFDSARGVFSDLDAMITDLAKADVVFVGEEHDSHNTHQLELAILQGVAARRPDAIVAMEMFERDVQEPFDHFQMGHTSEEDFLAAARPWPRYATDYKPLVDFAISKNWSVIASNVPRSFASDVAKGGLDVLQSKPADQQAWFAHDLKCPTDDEYFKRFAEAMGDHPAAPGSGQASIAAARQTLERTVLRAVSQGRDHGRVDRLGVRGRRGRRQIAARHPLQRRIPLRLRPRHRGTREAPDARQADRRRDRVAGGSHRRGRTERERAEASGLPRVHSENQ